MRWSEDDKGYVGYCPDLFPWAGFGEYDERLIAGFYDLVAEEISNCLLPEKSFRLRLRDRCANWLTFNIAESARAGRATDGLVTRKRRIARCSRTPPYEALDPAVFTAKML